MATIGGERLRRANDRSGTAEAPPLRRGSACAKSGDEPGGAT
ncbi:hypothetical protein [Cohnella fermenti]|nr:hypothetical protein [Cohnella fermenti]